MFLQHCQHSLDVVEVDVGVQVDVGDVGVEVDVSATVINTGLKY